MRILLDVDGVCADFMAAVHRVLPHVPLGVFTTYHIFDHLDAADEKLLCDAMADGEFWRGMIPLAGAQQALVELRRAGHLVFFVTAPWPHCSTWAYERTNWCVAHLGAGVSEVITAHAKYCVTGDVFVDDHEDNCISWADSHPGKLCIIPAWPATPQLQGVSRVYNGWTGVADMLFCRGVISADAYTRIDAARVVDLISNSG